MELSQIAQPDPAIKYNKDIAIAKEMSRLHLWRDIENQHRNFSTFIANLCQSHGCAAPSLDVDPTCPIPHYHNDGVTGHIFLDKYSVISMLHELGHHFGYDESECKLYSEWVFAHAFPVSFGRLTRDARGYLVKGNCYDSNLNVMAQAIVDTRDIVNTETM